MSNIVEYSTFISGEKENFNKLDQTRWHELNFKLKAGAIDVICKQFLV